MKETSKAMKRRYSENAFAWSEIFRGAILDVGSGDDPLPSAAWFNLADGGGDDITQFIKGVQFDCIHASNVLEHMRNPVVALNSWLKILKPRGYIVATVPDFTLYEHRIWPSRWNAGHRSTWELSALPTGSVEHIRLPGWLHEFPVEVLKCALIDTNYDYSLGPEVDQTLDASKGVECFIELCIRKL